jgi:hypothetical protein
VTFKATALRSTFLADDDLVVTAIFGAAAQKTSPFSRLKLK